VWHIRTSGATLGTELSEASALIGYIRTYFPSTTTLTLGTVVEEGTSREIIPTMASLSGSGTGSAPQALALVVTWRTTIAARRGRGRTFVGPLPTNAIQSDGTPSVSLLSTVGTAAAALSASSTALGAGAIGVWGYSAAKAPGTVRDPADAKVFRDFTGYGIRDLFGVLRSRRD